MISLPACTLSAGWHLGGGFGSHKAAPFFYANQSLNRSFHEVQYV